MRFFFYRYSNHRRYTYNWNVRTESGHVTAFQKGESRLSVLFTLWMYYTIISVLASHGALLNQTVQPCLMYLHDFRIRLIMEPTSVFKTTIEWRFQLFVLELRQLKFNNKKIRMCWLRRIIRVNFLFLLMRTHEVSVIKKNCPLILFSFSILILEMWESDNRHFYHFVFLCLLGDRRTKRGKAKFVALFVYRHVDFEVMAKYTASKSGLCILFFMYNDLWSFFSRSL